MSFLNRVPEASSNEGSVLPSDQISGLSVELKRLTSTISWVNPSDTKYKGVVIVYKADSKPSSPTDGTVIYDSNDVVPPTSSSFLTSIVSTTATIHYFRAFAYTYLNATRVYTTTETDAITTSVYSAGQSIITSSGRFTVPAYVNFVDAFLVGGGGSNAGSNRSGIYTHYSGGGGGGYTKTVSNIAVTPSSSIPVTIGSAGGATTFGSYSVNGGSSGIIIESTGPHVGGGHGGSGGGAGGYYGEGNPRLEIEPVSEPGGYGGSDGSDGGKNSWTGVLGGAGQGTTTRAFGESDGTLYSYGGSSVGLSASTNGLANTGNGNGGTGIVIIRW